MLKKKLFYLIFLLCFSISYISGAGTIQLPQTGQTKCYDSSGNQIACEGTGQDGDIKAGVAWPSPRFINNGDGTVTDNLTGLMWTKNANLPNLGLGKTWQQALDYVASLNSSNYLGFSDWRLPNINELESLINADEPNSAIWLKNQFFMNVQWDRYWTSTTSADCGSCAWGLGIQDGKMSYFGKDALFYVWPVRAGQSGIIQLPMTGQTMIYAAGDDGDLEKGVAWPNPRFSDNENGTVTDNLTGLMWVKSPDSTERSRSDAIAYCDSLTLAGHTDWRLPNRKELRSLVDYSKWGTAIIAGHPFTNVQSGSYDYYLSSSTYPDYWCNIWSVNFSIGNEDIWSVGYPGDVWPVRSVISAPTIVSLTTFKARQKGKKVIVNWETALEIDNEGFNILRASSVDGKYVKINDEMIRAKGNSLNGREYQFKDNNIKAGKKYYYKIEDINTHGTITSHNPVEIQITGKNLKQKK
ncbi:MAG: DUF1566 domain-containing protein [Candidatus Schekmanbacteria bacterium]|nr:DUF1566 domain-containing protein [Candidatus Schekmanbacteria bacterium]